MAALRGSLVNRMLENTNRDVVITVGMHVTEFMYTDRHVYEVVAVKDQKHVSIRELDAIHVGAPMTNEWELVSNEGRHIYTLVKRGKYWYKRQTISASILDELENMGESERDDVYLTLWHADLTEEELRAKGTVYRYHRFNCKFDYSDYYYDYEF